MKIQNLRDLVCFIENLTKINVHEPYELNGKMTKPKKYPSDYRYKLQDILIGNGRRNGWKEKYGELQNFENFDVAGVYNHQA